MSGLSAPRSSPSLRLWPTRRGLRCNRRRYRRCLAWAQRDRSCHPTAHTGGDIVAPMPGTILSVAVTVGQQIEAGHVVCVLEAMKMKNPIRATHSGAVSEIVVQAGQTVAHGELLVRLT